MCCSLWQPALEVKCCKSAAIQGKGFSSDFSRTSLCQPFPQYNHGDCCSLVDAIKREESAGNPLKQMLKAIDIPKHQLNESSIDLPIVPNKVLKHANKFHTPTDHEVSLFLWMLATQQA